MYLVLCVLKQGCRVWICSLPALRPRAISRSPFIGLHDITVLLQGRSSTKTCCSCQPCTVESRKPGIAILPVGPVVPQHRRVNRETARFASWVCSTQGFPQTCAKFLLAQILARGQERRPGQGVAEGSADLFGAATDVLPASMNAATSSLWEFVAVALASCHREGGYFGIINPMSKRSRRTSIY